MKMYSNGVILLIFVALMISVSSGSGLSQYPNVKNAMNQIHITSLYPKNKNGQTYGSAAYATSPETEPDLILATGVDGTEGYLLKKTWMASNQKHLKKLLRYRTADHQTGGIFHCMTRMVKL